MINMYKIDLKFRVEFITRQNLQLIIPCFKIFSANLFELFLAGSQALIESRYQLANVYVVHRDKTVVVRRA